MATFFAELVRVFISGMLGISILTAIIVVSPFLLLLWFWEKLSPAQQHIHLRTVVQSDWVRTGSIR